jgi:hypothetical protein
MTAKRNEKQHDHLGIFRKIWSRKEEEEKR